MLEQEKKRERETSHNLCVCDCLQFIADSNFFNFLSNQFITSVDYFY